MKNNEPAFSGYEEPLRNTEQLKSDALDAWTRVYDTLDKTEHTKQEWQEKCDDMKCIRKALEQSLDGEIEGFGELQERLEQLTKQYINQFGDVEITTELFLLSVIRKTKNDKR